MSEITELVERAKQAPTVTVYLPGGNGDVYSNVVERLKEHLGEVPKQLGPYVEVLGAIWPQLKANEEALMLLACEVYLEVAETYGFKIEPEHLTIGGERDTRGVHGNANWHDCQADLEC